MVNAGFGQNGFLSTALLGVSPVFAMAFFASALMGATQGMFMALVNTLLQEALPVIFAEAKRAKLEPPPCNDTIAPVPIPRIVDPTGSLAHFHERLVELDAFPGLPAEKVARLRAVALAALDGRLDSARLRAMPLADAVAELRTIRGVGPWTAQHIVMRGCGVIDELPSAEPRVLRNPGPIVHLFKGCTGVYFVPSVPCLIERLF